MALRASLTGLCDAPTRVRAISDPVLVAAVAEGVRMRKAGLTQHSIMAFHRFLREVGVRVEGEEQPRRLTASYSATRAYILEILGYRWPTSTGATGFQNVSR